MYGEAQVMQAVRTIDPRIGILCKEGAQVFYAFVNGYDRPEIQGTLEEVEVALGVRPEPAPAPAPRPAQKLRSALKARPSASAKSFTKKRARTYVARVTSPDGTVYEYETRAFNKTEARTEIRRLFRIDVPSPKNGFHSFEEHSFEWIEEDE